MPQVCAAAVTQTITELGKISWTIFGAPFQFKPETNAEFAASKRVIDDTCYEMIARRRSTPAAQRPNDLLSLLLRTGGEADGLSDLQIRDEIVTMLVGGHETTALALAWAWKALSENPSVEARLHREVDEVIGDGALATDDLPKLSWTRACFQEAMRLYPLVCATWGGVGIETNTIDAAEIPRGACVMISQWFTHRHKDFWESPDAFDPSRFLEPVIGKGHRYSYFPFAGGRHQCLGMHPPAKHGRRIHSSTLSKCFAVRPIAGQVVRPLPGITLRQAPPLRATLEPRTVRHAAVHAISTEAQ